MSEMLIPCYSIENFSTLDFSSGVEYFQNGHILPDQCSSCDQHGEIIKNASDSLLQRTTEVPIELQEIVNQDSFNNQHIDLFENNLITPTLLEACGIDYTPFYSALDHQINLAMYKSLLPTENPLVNLPSAEQMEVFADLAPQIHANLDTSFNIKNTNIVGFAFKQHPGESNTSTSTSTIMPVTVEEAKTYLATNSGFRALLDRTGAGGSGDGNDPPINRGLISTHYIEIYVVEALLEALEQIIEYMENPNSARSINRICTLAVYIIKALQNNNHLQIPGLEVVIESSGSDLRLTAGRVSYLGSDLTGLILQELPTPPAPLGRRVRFAIFILMVTGSEILKRLRKRRES